MGCRAPGRRASDKRLTPLDAELYALTHRGNPGDVDYYAELCRGAASVLELGSGSGRMLSALAEPGRELWGLELDPGLLRLGRRAVAELGARKRRGVRLVRADMQSFELGRRFERVLLPYNALYCLLSQASLERCLRAVRAALAPGGVFAFDVWCADRLHEHGLAPVEEDEELTPLVHAGRAWRVFEGCRRASGSQRLDVTYTYVPEGRARVRRQRIEQRYYLSSELFGALTRAGFSVSSKHGSFARGRFGARSARLIVLARPRE